MPDPSKFAQRELRYSQGGRESGAVIMAVPDFFVLLPSLRHDSGLRWHITGIAIGGFPQMRLDNRKPGFAREVEY